MRLALHRFWEWYQRHYLVTLSITTAAFLLQVFHLYWLFTAVILRKLIGHSVYALPEAGMVISILADYVEVPSLISASMLYLFELRRQFSAKSLLYLLLLNTQWVHILWITDEVVMTTFTRYDLVAWNTTVAWVAILIDYLEVPVIIDTVGKVYRERRAIWRQISSRPADPANGIFMPDEPGTIPAGAGDGAMSTESRDAPAEASGLAQVQDKSGAGSKGSRIK